VAFDRRPPEVDLNCGARRQREPSDSDCLLTRLTTHLYLYYLSISISLCNSQHTTHEETQKLEMKRKKSARSCTCCELRSGPCSCSPAHLLILLLLTAYWLSLLYSRQLRIRIIRIADRRSQNAEYHVVMSMSCQCQCQCQSQSQSLSTVKVSQRIWKLEIWNRSMDMENENENGTNVSLTLSQVITTTSLCTWYAYYLTHYYS